MYSFTLYQSLKYTKQKKRFTGAGQKLLQHSQSSPTGLTIQSSNSRRKRCAYTVTLFVRQCENGVMKRNNRALQAYKVFRGKLVK